MRPLPETLLSKNKKLNMRKLKQYFLIIALLLGSVAIGQAQSAKEMLTKAWSFSFDGMMSKMSESERKKISKMSDEQKEMLRSMMEKSYIIFKADGVMEAFMNGKQENMTWKLSKDGKTLITTEESGKVTELKVVELTSNKLVLQENYDAQEMTLVFKPKVD